MPSQAQVYYDTQANILALTASQISKGSVFFATDTGAVYIDNGTSIVPFSGYAVASGSSAGLSTAGNLNPAFTPVKNGLYQLTGVINLYYYSTGSVGAAITFTEATAGGTSAAVQKYLLKELTIKNLLKSNALATAGAASGVYTIIDEGFYASGGKAITPSITLTGTSKYSVYWRLSPLP